ncbi:AraC family transcriptional regulator [Bordetella genomosp. 13]|uniref:AraC family transcriptional regulator n=1 Tax=Bordetella genomosp. 13 TaxID=463040 RepID=UPI0011AA02B2|nr:AraC family transcriptional regulator [Bordetella genomosp. 13]
MRSKQGDARGRGYGTMGVPDAGAPADVMPVTLRQVLSEAMRHGVAPEALCDGLGFVPQDLDAEDFLVSEPQCAAFIRRAMRLLQRPTLGLELGVRVNLVSWGPVGLGFMASGSSRELLEFAITFQRAAGRLPRLSGETLKNSYCLGARAQNHGRDVATFLVDETFAALGQICRQVVGSHFNPRQIDLVMDRPPYGAVYEEVFRCSVRFGQAENRMYFPLEPYAIRSADARVLRQVVKWLAPRDEPAREAGSALEATVTQAIRRNLADPPPLRDVAALLHTSERTLRRRLTQAGRSYAELLAEERRGRALSLISHTLRPMREIALECGFTDVRTLQRAVKRWTGLSPTALRRERHDAAACCAAARPRTGGGQGLNEACVG